MALRLVAIVPKRAPMDAARVVAGLNAELRDFAQDLVAAMAKYPPQEDTDYVRTGKLGQRWQIRIKSPVHIEVFNNVRSGGTTRKRRGAGHPGGRRRGRTTKSSPYAVFVQGPQRGGKGQRQTKVMRDKGWQNITDETQRIWRRHRLTVLRILTS